MKPVKIGHGRVKKSTRSRVGSVRATTTPAVADVLFILITVVFFAICVAYVRWCDRIIGPDEWTVDTADGGSLAAVGADAEEVAA